MEEEDDDDENEGRPRYEGDGFSKRFNPTVLMKNKSMKEHFKK